MSWYIWTSLAALLFCVVLLGEYFVRLLKHGSPKDLSQKSGNIAQAVCYSCIGAMSPMQKESAYLHLPTYTAGIFFHIGNFLAIAVYLLFTLAVIFNFQIPIESATNLVVMILAAIIFIAAVCGMALFIKRLAKKELRDLSCADDYISNLLHHHALPDDLFPADLTIRGSVLCYNGTSFRVDALGQNQTRALLFLCQVSFGLFLRLAWNMAS